MELHEDQYLYVAGRFRDTSDFDPGPDSLMLVSNGQEDIFMMKMDIDGNVIWAKSFGGPNDDGLFNGPELAVTSSGKVVGVGSYRGTCDFDPGPDSELRTSEGETDVFIIQLTTDGELDWVHTMGNSEYDDARNVSIDHLGNIHVTGTIANEVDMDPGPGEFYLPLDDDSVMHFVAVYGPSGNFINAFVTDVGFAAIDLDNTGNF